MVIGSDKSQELGKLDAGRFDLAAGLLPPAPSVLKFPALDEFGGGTLLAPAAPVISDVAMPFRRQRLGSECPGRVPRAFPALFAPETPIAVTPRCSMSGI